MVLWFFGCFDVREGRGSAKCVTLVGRDIVDQSGMGSISYIMNRWIAAGASPFSLIDWTAGASPFSLIDAPAPLTSQTYGSPT
jgi:hypothetical protein